MNSCTNLDHSNNKGGPKNKKSLAEIFVCRICSGKQNIGRNNKKNFPGKKNILPMTASLKEG